MARREVAEVRPMAVLDYIESVQAGAGWPSGVYAPNPDAVANVFLSRGPAYAGLLDGKLLGVAGIMLLWPGVGEAWAVLTDDGRKHGYAFHVAVRNGYRQIVRDFHLRRVHAWIAADNLTAATWAMRLGFDAETPRLKGYGPQGQDFVLMTQFPQQEAV